MVLDLGVEIYHPEPKLPGIGLYQDLGMTMTNLVGSEELAREMIRGEVVAYDEIKPDVVMHGFWPIAGLGRRMVQEEVPGICFVPLPLVRDFFKVLRDVPEQLKIFSICPKSVRLWLFCHIPDFIRDMVPISRQNNIRRAAYDLGWRGEKLINVFDLLKSDLTVVNDLACYYDADKFSSEREIYGAIVFHSRRQDANRSGNNESL
jgi:hypothetical protein